MTYEKAYERLEEISQALSKNDIALDESLELYAEGVKLLNFCNSKLRQAKLKLQDLNGNDLEGEL